MSRWICGILLLALLGSGGCSETTLHQLNIHVYGEEFIEDQIPSAETDGWSISFDQFLVSIGNVRVLQGTQELFSQPDFMVFDLTEPTAGVGQEINTLDTPAVDGLHEVIYQIAPSTTAQGSNVSAVDLQLIQDNGWSILVRGTANNGTDTKTFTIGFTANTTYSGCYITLSYTNGAADAQITIHGDHLFYSDLTAEPQILFGPWAEADSNDDGEITAAELQAVPVNDVVGVDNLLELVIRQVEAIGHINGEGHCASTLE
ncbi:MAG: hypothetical protein HJJLKODD_00489 [Phycisphaerae bacterium]|nr:hypothetical protein [Phycisphaerae bacterium]